MSEVKDAAKELVRALKAERDDLKVQLHLAALDAKDQVSEDWSALEARWAQVKADARVLGDRAQSKLEVWEDGFEDWSERLGDQAEDLLDDIRHGYKDMRRKLRGD